MIRCVHCGHGLSAELELVDEGFESEWPEAEQAVPLGRMWNWAHESILDGAGIIMINVNDNRGMVADRSGTGGCCGNSRHVITHRCARCLTPVGTDINDCWTGLYFYFRPDAVAVGEPAPDQEERRTRTATQSPAATAKATLYQIDPRQFLVTSWSRTVDGHWFENQNVDTITSATADHRLAPTVLRVFERSAFDVETPSSDEESEGLLVKAGVSTKTQFMRNTLAVNLQRDVNGVVATPTQNRGVGAGFSPLSALATRVETPMLSDSDHHLEQAILGALKRSK